MTIGQRVTLTDGTIGTVKNVYLCDCFGYIYQVNCNGIIRDVTFDVIANWGISHDSI